jgi:hypothetical protein
VSTREKLFPKRSIKEKEGTLYQRSGNTMDEELKEIKRLIVGLCEYLQVTLTIDQIKLYANEFKEVGPQGLGLAISRLKRDPDLWPGKFPLPARIKSYLVPNSESDAKEIVSLIFESIQLFGKTKQREAKEYMGDLAWEICKSYGSFSSLCDMDYHQKPTIFAQLRDLAENKIRRRRFGFQRPSISDENTTREIEHKDSVRKNAPEEIGKLLHTILREDT